jgi:hypothetical protein
MGLPPAADSGGMRIVMGLTHDFRPPGTETTARRPDSTSRIVPSSSLPDDSRSSLDCTIRGELVLAHRRAAGDAADARHQDAVEHEQDQRDDLAGLAHTSSNPTGARYR